MADIGKPIRRIKIEPQPKKTEPSAPKREKTPKPKPARRKVPAKV